jgi:hypothetical protein
MTSGRVSPCLGKHRQQPTDRLGSRAETKRGRALRPPSRLSKGANRKCRLPQRPSTERQCRNPVSGAAGVSPIFRRSRNSSGRVRNRASHIRWGAPIKMGATPSTALRNCGSWRVKSTRLKPRPSRAASGISFSPHSTPRSLNERAPAERRGLFCVRGYCAERSTRAIRAQWLRRTKMPNCRYR